MIIAVLMIFIVWSIMGSEAVADAMDDMGVPPITQQPVVYDEIAPNPIQTPKSNVTDWNPYVFLPAWKPPLDHISIYRNLSPQNIRQSLNTTYSGSVGLAGFAVGKELNITNGPFSITYSVHPNISSPHDVWVKITIFDPWQQIVAEGGYNRCYPSQETQTMTIYREGRYYLSVEGEFATIDYTIKTADLTPVVSSPTSPIPDSRFEENGELL